jgi:G:T/U-mismatch repair DNA glycosylase
MYRKEYHPYLKEGIVKGATRLVLGSFPVFACTDPDSSEKRQIRNTDGTVRFFYGSSKNKFWGLYHEHIDPDIIVPVRKSSALKSLRTKKIAFTDAIVSCRRKGKSSSDSDLYDKEFNVEMIQILIQNGVTKVLCTSKGVLTYFDRKVMSSVEGVKFDKALTKEFSDNFLGGLNGRLSSSNKGICFVYRFKKQIIYALAIPSPGSPQRQAHNFGCVSEDKVIYTKRYFMKAFKWIKK